MKKKFTVIVSVLLIFIGAIVKAQPVPTPADPSTGVSINPTFAFTNYDAGNGPYTFQLGIVGGNHNILTRSVSEAEAAA